MWQEQLKKQWNQNPIQVLIVGSLVASAAAKVLNALSAAQGRRAYAKQVKYRTKH